MGENEEKKEEKREEIKVPSLEEMYNADTPQGASLRKIYDLQNGKLVVRTEQQKAVESMAKTAAQQLGAKQNPPVDPALQQALNPLDQAEKDYDQIVSGMVAERDAYVKETAKTEKANTDMQFYGGLAEAASALVNLIGTTKGAVSQKWESPQPRWAERADILRKERETKLKNYKDQITALQQAKNQIKQKKASVISTYNTQKETTARTNARIQASADLAIAKAQEAARVKLAKSGEDGIKLINNNANRLLLGMIREYGAMGIMPTESNMKRWADLAYQAALGEYRELHPEDFEDTILP